MPAGQENVYFRDLPPAEQINAVQLYLGPYARGDAINRTLQEAAANPTVAESIMRRYAGATVPGGDAVASVERTIDAGASPQGAPTEVGPVTVDGQPVGTAVVADGGGDGSDLLPYALGGAAAAGAYALGRRRTDGGGGTEGHTDPQVRASGNDPRRPTGGSPPQGALPGSSGPATARYVHEGDYIPADRPVVRVDPITGDIIEGEVITRALPTTQKPVGVHALRPGVAAALRSIR